MTSSHKRQYFPVALIIFTFLITPILSSAATSTTYIYDDLNRLKRVQYSDDSYIEYNYDAIGNRISVTPTPISGASHSDGYYASAISVSLSCSELAGPGCYRVYYTTDGSTPTTASAYYTSLINLSSATILKFFAVDVAGFGSPMQTKYYTFDVVNGIKNMRTSAVYSTLQAAYNAAINGDTIKVQAGRLYQGIDAASNKSITLEGGYNANYLYYMGNSRVRGAAQTQPGGGTVTIKNFALETQ